MKLACGGTLSLPAFQAEGVDVELALMVLHHRNGLNILAEARTAALVQRHDHWDPTLLPAKDVFQMITKDSRDWVAWDLEDLRMFPRGRSNNRHIANLVFNGARCLDMWVDGAAVRIDGITQTIDEKLAMQELDAAVESYYEGVE